MQYKSRSRRSSCTTSKSRCGTRSQLSPHAQTTIFAVAAALSYLSCVSLSDGESPVTADNERAQITGLSGPVSAEVSYGKEFTVEDATKVVQEQFDAHKCEPLDSSQNALRIVREATEGK